MVALGVVVPAHNEERTIGRLLSRLQPLAGEVSLVVVCNGCTDDTAGVVRREAPWATVVELAEGSKPRALNAGDDTLSADAIRLYLDADVIITAESVRTLAEELGRSEVLAVAPSPTYNYSGASPIVRSHYRVWTALYKDKRSLAGTGAIMVSIKGRQRFAEWPDIIADDFYVDGLFADHEKARVGTSHVEVRLPTTLHDCVSRRARVHQGTRDVFRGGFRADETSAAHRGATLAQLVRRRPHLAFDVPAHLFVTLASRIVAAWRRQRGTAQTFYRDGSTRS